MASCSRAPQLQAPAALLSRALRRKGFGCSHGRREAYSCSWQWHVFLWLTLVPQPCQTFTWEQALQGFALLLQNSLRGAVQNRPSRRKGSGSLKWEADIRDITHGRLGEEPGLGPGCCKLCLCSCYRDKHVSRRVKDVKDQPTSANVRDVTVSTSENPKHKPLLWIKENLAILRFPAFLGVHFFFKQSEKRK